MRRSRVRAGAPRRGRVARSSLSSSAGGGIEVGVCPFLTFFAGNDTPITVSDIYITKERRIVISRRLEYAISCFAGENSIRANFYCRRAATFHARGNRSRRRPGRAPGWYGGTPIWSPCPGWRAERGGGIQGALGGVGPGRLSCAGNLDDARVLERARSGDGAHPAGDVREECVDAGSGAADRVLRVRASEYRRWFLKLRKRSRDPDLR